MVSSIEVQDELFAPRETVTLEYKGPNPMGVYGAIDGLAKRHLEAKGTNAFEVDFRWDTTQDPRGFFINYFIEKSIDKFTKFRVDFKLQGSQPTDPKKDGYLKVEVRGLLRSKYEPSGYGIMQYFFKAFYYVYHVTYYNQRRRRYLEYLRRRVDTMINEIRSTLKIPTRPI